MSTALQPQQKSNQHAYDTHDSVINNSLHSSVAKCIIYWDFDTNPITNEQQLRDTINDLNQQIRDKIGSKPIQYKIYSCSNKLSTKLQEDFDINGIQHIITSLNIIDS
eukprot:470014_1